MFTPRLYGDGIKRAIAFELPVDTGGRRDEIQRIIDGRKRIYKQRKRGVAIYGMVLAYDQKKNGDLDRQTQVLRDDCTGDQLQWQDAWYEVLEKQEETGC